jgi:tetratricopeptide (TPR) repeat protein
MALAQVLEAIGDVSQARQKSAEALAVYQESQKLFANIINATSANFAFSKEKAGLLKRLSQLLTSLQQFDRALAAWQEYTELLQQLAETDAADPEWNRELTVAWEGIGYVYARQQKFEDAIGAYQKAVAILEKLKSAEPDNFEFEESRAGTELTIAKLLLSKGDTDAAHAAFKASSDALFELSQRGRLDEQGRKWLEEADTRLRQPF